MSAEGFMFNKRFAEALAELPAEEYKKVMVAVANYAMEGIIPEDLSGAEKAIFLLMKPQIDISEKRRESGRKGGEAKQSNAEASSSKEEANASKDVANSSKVVANCSK